MKATFDIVVIAEESKTVLSNMVLKLNDRVALFDNTTIKISCYSL
jgi:hypothetical protein